MTGTLPPCPRCAGRLLIEYPSARFAMLNLKPEAVCLQCGWRRGVRLAAPVEHDAPLPTITNDRDAGDTVGSGPGTGAFRAHR